MSRQAFKHGLLIARREVVDYIEARGFNVCRVLKCGGGEYAFLLQRKSRRCTLRVLLGVLQINHDFEERSERQGRFALTGAGVQVVKVLGMR